MIDGDRLLAGLHELRRFGATGTGVVRPTFSEPDLAARAWLRDRMTEAGLDARIDGVGNVVGRSRRPGPALLLGSHSDTQPTGGWLDGALGVAYAIEVAHALGADPATADLAVDAVAWSDEEGTYTSCLGSRSFAGRLTGDDLAEEDAAGESAAAAIERVGLAGLEPARFEPDRHVGYLEAHIEQGPWLDAEGDLIGVVTSIVGIRALRITIAGRQNHAGTTPMPRRADAGVALFDYAVELRRRFAELAGPDSVWTIGNAGLEPGAESIVPGAAWCTLQFRDPDDERLARLETAAVELAAELTARGPCRLSAERRRVPIVPTVMDESLRAHLRTAAEAVAPGRWREMPSAAGHDAMELAHVMPCAMVFIPSIDGVSHDFAEDTHHDDIVRGCEVLARATVAALRAAAVS